MPNKNLLVAILAVGVSAAATAGMSSSSSAAKNSNSSVTSSAGSKAANGAGANGGSNNFNMTGSASVYMGNYSADLSNGNAQNATVICVKVIPLTSITGTYKVQLTERMALVV